MFYSFYKIIIFSLNKEKDDTRSAYCKFSKLGDSQPHCSGNFGASWRYGTHLLTNPKPTYYPNYSIKYFESTDQRIALKLTILDLNYMHFTLIKN